MKGANLKKRRWGLALSAIAILAAAALPAWAEGSAAPASWGEGTDGSAEHPYEISDAAGLKELAQNVNGGNTYSDTYFVLKKDIDLSKEAGNWEPIGKDDTYIFSGTFDGDGKTISGYKIESNNYSYSYAGLFGYVRNGTIISLDVTDFVISVNCTAGSVNEIDVGGLAGRAYQGAISVVNCAAGSISVSAPGKKVCAGGLLGASYYISITNACSAVKITVTSGSEHAVDAGGLVGYLFNNDLSNSYATGSVYSSVATAYAGGLVGEQQAGGGSCTITNSYAAGSVSVFGDHKGGLIGHYNTGSLANSVFDKQSTGQTKGIGNLNENQQDGVTSKDNAAMIADQILSETDSLGGGESVWKIVPGYYPQLKALAAVFPEASALSAVPVRFGNNTTEKSQSVALPFVIPGHTPPVGESSPGLSLLWDWNPRSALKYVADAGGERRLAPRYPFSRDVVLTVSAAAPSGGTMTKTFALTTASPDLDISLYKNTGTEPDPDHAEYLERHTFPGQTTGYGPVESLNVSVFNTGKKPTGKLSAELSGPDGAAFEILDPELDNIGTDENDKGSFSVAPRTELSPKTYTTAVTLSSADSGGALTAIVELSFTVGSPYVPPDDPPEPEVYGISLDVGPVYTFPEVIGGYRIAPLLNVAVANTGDRPTGGLYVLLSGPDSANFRLSPESLDSIAGTGETRTFTVAPRPNLEPGTHRATVTVSGDHDGMAESFVVNFPVKAEESPAVVPVPGRLSFSLGMALGETQIFEALVSPDSAVEWSAVHDPSPDIFPTPGVHVVEIVSDDAAGERTRTASGRAVAYTQEPVAARRVRVTATALGTAEITVKTPDGEIFAKCLVAVNPAKEPPEPVIVERGGGGCQGAGAPGLVMGLAVLALALAARRAGATRRDAQRAPLRKTPAGHP